MENLCRICRKICLYNPVPIFSTHNGISLKEILTKTCPVDITSDDQVSQLFPQFICTECLNIVTAAYNLQQICLESDQYFRAMISGEFLTVKIEKFDDDLGLIKQEQVEVEIRESAPKRRKRLSTTSNSDFDGFSEDEFVPEKKKPRKSSKKPKKGSPDTFDRKSCNFCGRKMWNILKHMRIHCPDSFPFPCEFCFKRFENQQDLTEHIARAHRSSKVKSTLFCDVCGRTGNNKVGMETHIMEEHLKIFRKNNSFSQKCAFCRARFYEKRQYDNHLMKKHGEMVKCDKCDANLKTKAEIEYHTLMVHERQFRELEQHEVEISFKCCVCEVDHANEDELVVHLDSHRETFKTGNIRCHLCRKIMHKFEFFISHAKYHAQPHTHECLTCKKLFPFDEKFVAHVKYHKSYVASKVECPKCLQMLSSVKDLEDHDKVKHQKETLFMCPICAKSLATVDSLNQHLRYVHSKEEEKQFKCKFCSKGFFNKSKLTQHEAIHSTERPHICQVCGSAFKLQATLVNHMQQLHDPNLVAKFECKQCPKKFTKKSRLDQHMYTHNGLKPHECKFCDKAYANKGDLVKHLKIHVGDAIYQCDKCPKGFRVIVELREHQMEHARQ